MKKALIPVAKGYMDWEVAYPYDRLKEADFDVTVYCAIPTGTNKYGHYCTGRYGLPIPVHLTTLDTNLPDLLFIPGGVESTEVLRQDQSLLSLIKEMLIRERVVAQYCHAAQILISAGVTKGRKMTCYKGMMIDLKNSGAEVPDESVKVVIDGNLISSQHYHNNPEFMRAVLETYRLREEVVH
jgi:protease I